MTDHPTDQPQANDDDAARSLAAWLRDLADPARCGKSQAEIARDIGVDRRSIVHWLSVEKPIGPSAVSLLAFLASVGVTITPAPPREIPGAVSMELRDLREEVARLAELVERVERAVDG